MLPGPLSSLHLVPRWRDAASPLTVAAIGAGAGADTVTSAATNRRAAVAALPPMVNLDKSWLRLSMASWAGAVVEVTTGVGEDACGGGTRGEDTDMRGEDLGVVPLGCHVFGR